MSNVATKGSAKWLKSDDQNSFQRVRRIAIKRFCVTGAGDQKLEIV